MGYHKLKETRFDRLRNTLDSDIEVEAIILDEEYVPTHKQAGFVPYDAVVVFKGELNSDEVDEFLTDSGVKFDKVTGVTDNTDTQYEGSSAAFVSLAEYDSD